MKKFFFKIGLFSGVFMFIFFFTICALNFGMNQQRFYKIPDGNICLILGHSHPETAFNDSLISSTSNFGLSGESYFYSYAKAKKLIECNSQIKTVFVEFSVNQVEKSSDELIWGNTTMSWAYPLFSHLFSIQEYLILLRHNFKYTLEAQSLSVQNCFQFLFGTNRVNLIGDSNFGGYLRLTKDGSNDLKNSGEIVADDTLIEISKTNLKYLKNIIKLCRDKRISVYLARTPVHKSYSGRRGEKTFLNVLKSDFNDVDFFDFIDFPLEDNEYADAHHLNYKGATKFSIFFNKLIQDSLLIRPNKRQFITDQMKKLN